MISKIKWIDLNPGKGIQHATSNAFDKIVYHNTFWELQTEVKRYHLTTVEIYIKSMEITAANYDKITEDVIVKVIYKAPIGRNGG
jgi:hypothetical protein